MDESADDIGLDESTHGLFNRGSRLSMSLLNNENAISLILADLRRTKMIYQKELNDLMEHEKENLGIKKDYLDSLQQYVLSLDDNLQKAQRKLRDLYFFLLENPRDITLLDMTTVEVVRVLHKHDEEVKADCFDRIFDEQSIEYIFQNLVLENEYIQLQKTRKNISHAFQSSTQSDHRVKDSGMKHIKSRIDQIVKSTIELSYKDQDTKPSLPIGSLVAESLVNDANFLDEAKLDGLKVEMAYNNQDFSEFNKPEISTFESTVQPSKLIFDINASIA